MLQEIRKLFGYTQEELAKKVGVTQNYYTQIESGSSRSAPLITRLSTELKIKESFLLGEYHDYPFLADSYNFCLTERKTVQAYRFIHTFICGPSKYVDVVFFLRHPKRIINLGPTVVCITIRDDHNNVFIFTTRVKSFSHSPGRGRLRDEPKKEVFHTTFPRVDSFREDLHKLHSTYVYEKSVGMDEVLENAVESGTVKKELIMAYFPTKEYLFGLCKAHGN